MWVAVDARSGNLSVMVRSGNGVTAAPPLMAMVPAGGVVSRTVTWNEPVAVLPWASLALQFTVVRPSGNEEPELGVHVTPTVPSTRSVAVAVNVTTVCGPVASRVNSAGRVRTGGGVACNVSLDAT